MEPDISLSHQIGKNVKRMTTPSAHDYGGKGELLYIVDGIVNCYGHFQGHFDYT